MTSNPSVRFLRVLSHRSRQPVVLAVVVGEYLVRWMPRDGWTCTCDEPGEDHCSHTSVVLGLLDPRVIGEDQ